MEALQRANEVRWARAELKRAVKAREVMVAEILAGDIPDWLEALPLEELMNAIPGFSWRVSQRLRQESMVSLTATMGGLTKRQLRDLGGALADWEAAAQQRRARPRRRGASVPRRSVSA